MRAEFLAHGLGQRAKTERAPEARTGRKAGRSPRHVVRRGKEECKHITLKTGVFCLFPPRQQPGPCPHRPFPPRSPCWWSPAAFPTDGREDLGEEKIRCAWNILLLPESRNAFGSARGPAGGTGAKPRGSRAKPRL